MIPTVSHHFFGAAHDIGDPSHAIHALGMRHHWSARILKADAFDSLGRKEDVSVTVSRPKLHASSGLAGDPLAQVLIRNKQDLFVSRNPIHDIDRISAGTNHIGKRLHLRGTIDVGDHHHTRVFLFVSGEFFSRA
ncbi:MAG: hypothetical protein BWY82_02061 [Verrucomicrobia bacterium ADurb.Bin474]|nr:MAG: hypothetical protein BWY82_02061 [Verrucomicrobia bacterium ADurb.Bin474]